MEYNEKIIRLSFYSEWHYNSVRDVSERTPSPPSVSTRFEDLTTPQRKKALEKQEDTYLYYSRDEKIENLRKRRRESKNKKREGEGNVLKRFKNEAEAEAHYRELRKISFNAWQDWNYASNKPWNKREKKRLEGIRTMALTKEREAEKKRDEAIKAREKAEQELKSIIEQAEQEDKELEEELARIRNNPTTPDELRENLEQMRLESNNDDYDDDYDEDNDDDKKSNRSGYSSANSYYSGEAVEAMEEIHKKKQKIAVQKHEAILNTAKLNHKRELEKKEKEMNEQIEDKERELLRARSKYYEFQKENKDLKSLNSDLVKANEDISKELKSNKENKKSVSFEDMKNVEKTEEENMKLKERIEELNKSHEQLKREFDGQEIYIQHKMDEHDELRNSFDEINEEFEKGLREERERWIKEKREVQKQYEDEVKTNVANIKAKKKLTEENQNLQKQILKLEEEIATVKLKPYVGKNLDGMVEELEEGLKESEEEGIETLNLDRDSKYVYLKPILVFSI